MKKNAKKKWKKPRVESIRKLKKAVYAQPVYCLKVEYGDFGEEGVWYCADVPRS